ncbi:SDR family NAD(P)-dependent oxidoreductase [Naasia lichenicola]|uniref:SDR family oxidoreductase n=1 Tax=Naasia lichenicola TaxID=2565933 RepID=A0A4S4FL89_9MICO|nr:SDR family oxidoreductase [Naasia lichenicola]THG30941.1 SDR family oxidoreductase [Naasia lichenicola]
MTALPVTTARLEGLRAIVTGGARGIGADIARRFTAEGARVAILDRLDDCGIQVAESIGGHYLHTDLADADDASRAMDDAIDRLGGVDILVNSAGVLKKGPLSLTTVAEWDTVFAINVRAMLITMQRASAWMLESGGGKIVNIASMAAKTGGADEGAYAASKAAVVALTRVAALEWGCHRVTVNAICPGYVLTEMGADTRTEADVAAWSALSPLGRLADPRDVSAVAAFLASSDADYLTGQAINVTGGMIMH